MSRLFIPLAFVLGFASPGHAAAPPVVLRDRYGDPLPPGAIARIGSLRFRHNFHWNTQERGPCVLAFDPDCRWLVTGASTFRLWETATGNLLHEFSDVREPAHPGGAFSPDGKWFFSWHGHQVWVRDFHGEKKLLQSAGNIGLVAGIAFHPDGRQAAVLRQLSDGSEIRLIQISTGQLLNVLRSKAPINDPKGLTFSPDGQRLVFASMCYLHTWDLARHTELPEINLRSWVNNLDFTSDSRWVALSLEDNTISLLCLEGRPVLVPTGITSEKRSDMRFLPGRKELLYAGRDGSVIAFAPLSQNKPRVILPPKVSRTGEPSHDTVFLSPNGRKAVYTRGPHIRMVDLETGRDTVTFDDHREPGFLETRITPCCRYVVSRSTTAIRIWELTTGKLLRRIDSPSNVAGLDITPDGRSIVAYENKGILWWDFTTGHLSRRIPVSDEQLVNISLIRQGQAVACTYSDRRSWDGSIAVLDASTGKPLANRNCFPHLAFLFLSGEWQGSYHATDYTFHLADLVTDRKLWKMAIPDGSPYHVSPDGRLFFGVGPEHFEIREMATGRLTRPPTIDHTKLLDRSGCYLLPAGRIVFAYALGAKRSHFNWPHPVTSSNPSQEVVLVETLSGKVRRHLSSRYKGAPVHCSPDGRYILTLDSDKSMLIWDVYRCRSGKVISPDRLWTSLASDDAEEAFDAVCQLIAEPAAAVEELGNRLHPSSHDLARVRQWLGNLASDSYKIREEASQNLAALGEVIEDELRQARRFATHPELRKRLDRLLAPLQKISVDPILLQRERALEALEHIGTREARALLQRLASGSKHARMTVEARAVLERLNGRVGR